MVPSSPTETVKFEVEGSSVLEILDDAGNPIEPQTSTVQLPGEEQIAESVLLRKRDQLRFIKRMLKMEARKRENARAQKTRTKKSRVKRELQKASRKRNRK